MFKNDLLGSENIFDFKVWQLVFAMITAVSHQKALHIPRSHLFPNPPWE